MIHAVSARRWACSVAPLLIAVLAPSAHADPFLTRNQSPLVALYGLPAPLPARLAPPGQGGFAAVVNWSNSEKEDWTSDRNYTLDAEVIEVRLHVDHSLGQRFALHAELPWRQISEGSLDSFVDSWHSAFGLPGGSRRRLPENQLLIEYTRGDTTLLRFDESTSGIGDIPVSAGFQWLADDRRALAAWLTLKAPTGSADDLLGSGAMDVALSLAGQSQLNERWRLFGQATVAWLGEGDVLPELQESFAWTLMGGCTWNAWRSLDLTAQVEANSAVFGGTGLDLDGDAVVVTFGGSWRTTGGWRFDVGISEDLQPDASPDVVFNFAAIRRYR